MRQVWTSVFLASCNPVFGLDDTIAIDAAVSIDMPPDRDGDGVSDDADNCASAANESQHDEDGDRLGDECDPCPMDPVQGDMDADGIGDRCDPHPAVAGDCLVLFESFRNSAAYREAWTAAGNAMPEDDAIVLAGATGLTRLAALGPVEAYSARVDFGVTAASAFAVEASAGPFGGGYDCLLYPMASDNTLLEIRKQQVGTLQMIGSLPTIVAGDAVWLAFVHDGGAGRACRVAYGQTDVMVSGGDASPAQTNIAFAAVGSPHEVTIGSIALYRTGAVPCSPMHR